MAAPTLAPKPVSDFRTARKDPPRSALKPSPRDALLARFAAVALNDAVLHVAYMRCRDELAQPDWLAIAVALAEDRVRLITALEAMQRLHPNPSLLAVPVPK